MTASRSGLPSCAVIVATYNWPAALLLVLKALRRQSLLPSEVIIADDGSGTDTADLIEAQSRDFPVPLRHVWHADEGFRLGAIRNRAISASQCDYIVQLDGDILLHPEAIRAHVTRARRGEFVQGSRALLGPQLTQELLQTTRAWVRPFEKQVRNRANGWYVPLFTPLFARVPNDPERGIRGCHMGFWRDDAVRVNGFNEAITGWGREDSEFVARLQHTGVRRASRKLAAAAWHLWHPEQPRAALPRNQAILEHTLSTRATWCELGLSNPTSVTATPSYRSSVHA